VAHHKSAKKRIRQTIKRTAANRSQSTETKSAVKKLREAIAANNKDEAKALLVTAQSKLAKLAKKGVIKDNKAGRTTARLSHQVNSL